MRRSQTTEPSNRPAPPPPLNSRLLDVESAAPVPEVAAHQLASLVQTLDVHPAKPRTIAFVSSGRGEGTTTCLANVANYLAQHQARVLMVDANLQWPALHTMAGVSRGPGVVEVLAGGSELKTAVQATDVRNLFVV